VTASRRIGITRAVSRPWRFHLAGHPSVSGSGHARARGGARPRRARSRVPD
jgi:3-methyladenine DNA glycosylase Mpg